jgi:hypothetical protein
MAKPDTTEFAPPKDEGKLIAWLQTKRESGKPRVSDLQMKLNLAYVMGMQWLVWDGSKRAFRRPQNRPGDPNAPIRVTVNKIGGIVERTTSKLTKNVPIPEARPVGDQDEDVDSAKVGTRILSHECYRLGWQTMLSNLYAAWVIPLGYSYLHVTWDSDAGSVVGEVDGKQIKEGEIIVEPTPAFEMRVDPNARLMKDAMWAERTVSMSKDAIFESFGVSPDGGEPGRTIADEVVDLVEANTGMGSQTRHEDFVEVHQFWMVPCRACPEGLVVTWCGKTILEKPKPFPYKHGRLPFIQFDLLPGIGMREGRTWVNDLIPIQTDYNDARSREATIRRTLNPKIVVPTGSIDPNRMTSRVEVISYNPAGQAPQFMMPDGRWMAQHETAMNRADSEMGERAGQSDASAGNAPSSMPAAAILALQEADDTKLALSAKLMAQSIQEFGWQVLMLAREFWLEERTVRTWSEDNTLQVDHFGAANLANGFDIHVSPESALPRSKAARTQLAVDLWTQGIITDPKTYLDMLDLPGTDFVREQYGLDQRRAQRENDQLRKGTPCQVYPWDNHSIHLTVLNDFRKTPDYENLPPQIKAVVDGHGANHESLVLQQMGSPMPGTGVQVDHPMTQPATGGAPGADAMYLDPTTGKPQDPLAVASGQAPSALENTPVKQRAGIGGPGQPGEVPGVSTDTQAFRQGS